jgi:DNA-binding SARP family transcriptional activator
MKDDKTLEFPVKSPRKIISLLKLLVSCGRNGASEEHLADLLWPDADADTALQSLATSIHRLRQLLGNDRALMRRDGRVKLDAGCCWVDAHAFEELLGRADGKNRAAQLSEDERASSVEKAVMLYGGAFMGESVEPWALSYRELLREKYLRAVRRLGMQYEGMGMFDRAIDWYQKGLETDNLAEEFYRRIMKCCSLLGRRAEAIAVYRRCDRVLRGVLGVGPSPETEDLFKSL